jgi:hypothetical protein
VIVHEEVGDDGLPSRKHEHDLFDRIGLCHEAFQCLLLGLIDSGVHQRAIRIGTRIRIVSVAGILALSRFEQGNHRGLVDAVFLLGEAASQEEACGCSGIAILTFGGVRALLLTHEIVVKTLLDRV